MKVMFNGRWKEFGVQIGERTEDESVAVISRLLEMECSLSVGQCLYDMAMYYEPEEGVSVLTGKYLGADQEEDMVGFLAEFTPEEISTYSGRLT